MRAGHPASIADYVAALPENVRPIAESLRQAIRNAAPGSVEDVKYGIPAFRMGSRPFIYFGIWKKHVGLYPIYRGTDEFEAEVGACRTKTDTVQFPLSKPLPLELIARIVGSQLANPLTTYGQVSVSRRA